MGSKCCYNGSRRCSWLILIGIILFANVIFIYTFYIQNNHFWQQINSREGQIMMMTTSIIDNSIPKNSTHSSKRILLLISDYKPPNERLASLLTTYQASIDSYHQQQKQKQEQDFSVEIDLYFLCHDNFDFSSNQTTLPCSKAALENKEFSSSSQPSIRYLLVNHSIAKPLVNKCSYCRQRKSPWYWSPYISVLLATRQLEENQSKTYDGIWFTEPDAEFLGNIAEWIANQERYISTSYKLSSKSSFSSPPLVSDIVMRNVRTAEKHLKPGMVARIHPNWARWKSAPNMEYVDFGTFVYVIRYSSEMIDAIEEYLSSSSYVEVYLPYACKKYFGDENCTASSLFYKDLGFLTTNANVFAGSNSSKNFHAIANNKALFGHNKWYHPTKFEDSWRDLPSINDRITDESPLLI